MARDRGGPALGFQLLVYPVTDHAFDTPSYRAFGRDYGLSEAAMRWYWAQYLARPEDGNNPLASPLKADLRGLPPALVITAEFDPLRDEGEAYAARLHGRGACASQALRRAAARLLPDGGRHGQRQRGHRRRRGSPGATLGGNPDRAATSSIDREAYARYAREHPGNPERGRMLFFDPKGAGCIRCHRARGEGSDLGPDLSDLGGKYERSLLIESVLDPSRQIVEGYRPTTVATADGRVVSGIVKGESAQDLTLVDAEGHRQVVRKSEIEKRSSCDTSLMPDGLNAGLKLADFADLIAYLEGLRSAGQGTPGSGSHGPITLPLGFRSEHVAPASPARPPLPSPPTAGSSSASRPANFG